MNISVSNKLMAVALSALVVLGSCSKEEDAVAPAPEESSQDLESVTLSFASESGQQVVAVPESMTSSDDPYAQSAATYVATVNQIGSYFTYFQPPAGAEKSSEPIAPANGRLAATNKQYLVYTWAQQEMTIAYQLSEESDKYVWEIFWKQGEGEFKKYLYAEESKTAKKGKLIVYGIIGTQNDVFSVQYDWEKETDGTTKLIGTINSTDDIALVYTIIVNPDASGSVEYKFAEGRYLMLWDGVGNGSWTLYGEDGNTLSGTWTA